MYSMQRRAHLSMPTSITTNCRARDKSDEELDVFEAARYFSGGFDGLITGDRLSFQRTSRQELLFKGDHRRSLDDMPMKKPKAPSSQEPHKNMERDCNEIKSKQPNSPGGRLASFFISLFHQRGSKKKTTKSLVMITTTRSMEDGDFEIIKHGQERRRKSTSYSQNISGDHHNCYSKSMLSSSKSSSGFRTPPPLPCMPKEKVTTSSLGGGAHGSGFMGSGDHHDQGHSGESSAREEGFMVKNVGFERREEEEEGGEFGGSDSSSDLFELKNYDLQEFSSDNLTFYGTTNAGITNIKGSTFPSGAF